MKTRLRTASLTECKTPIPLRFGSRVAWVSSQRRAAPPSGSLATIISYFFCCDYYAYNAKNPAAAPPPQPKTNTTPHPPKKSAVLEKGPRLGPKSVPPNGSTNSNLLWLQYHQLPWRSRDTSNLRAAEEDVWATQMPGIGSPTSVSGQQGT